MTTTSLVAGAGKGAIAHHYDRAGSCREHLWSLSRYMQIQCGRSIRMLYVGGAMIEVDEREQVLGAYIGM
jgi:hypothetical protein